MLTQEAFHEAFQETIQDHLTIINNSIASKANTNHKHKITDIEDHKEPESYNDSAIKELIDNKISEINNSITNMQTVLTNKADLNHNHTLLDIADYEAYDDTQIKTDIKNNATKITNIETNINTINNSLTNKVDITKTTIYYRTATHSHRWGKTNDYSYDIIGYIKPVNRTYTQISGNIKATSTTTGGYYEQFEVNILYQAGSGANKNFTLSGNSIVSISKGKSGILILTYNA